jgi:hypothetical protein
MLLLLSISSHLGRRHLVVKRNCLFRDRGEFLIVLLRISLGNYVSWLKHSAESTAELS